MKNLFSLSLIVLIFASACQPTSTEEQVEDIKTTTFILLRHAEKAKDDPRDPSLSEEGELRAQKLAVLLAPMEIDAIYSTPFKRTEKTVAPLAELKSLEVQNYNYQDSLLLHNFIQNHSGETIVISGHSNTTPVLANQLMGDERLGWLKENEYDKLFIVTAIEIGKGKLHLLSY